MVLILLLTYRSPVLPLLPLVTAGGALVASEAAIYLLAKHAGLVVNNQTSFILTVLVFGAATDYALLLTSRYREELGGTRTGTRPWRSHCTGPVRRSSQAPRPSRSA
ncbi:MMPL family transporter [Micromonospora sp. M12]